MKIEKLPLFYGIALSFVFFIFSQQYYEFRDTPDNLKKNSVLFETFETLDLRYNDFKYKLAPSKTTKAPVALVSIDDDSLTEIGRWPWSRDLMADMIENLMKYEVSSLGFDIIFSEPEKGNTQADEKLAATIEKYADKLVLGTFSENGIKSNIKFQDYCINEAFKKTGGEELVKLNATLTIDDSDDILESLPWNDLFKPIFSNIHQRLEANKISSLGKQSYEELHPFQKNALQLEQNKALFQYCLEWLTSNDPYLYKTNNSQLSFLKNDPISDEDKTKIKELYFKTFNQIENHSLEKITSWIFEKTLFNPIPQYGYWTSNIDMIQKKALYTASFVADQDRDGYIRRYPLFYRSGNRLGLSYIPSLSLQSYLVSKNYRAEIAIEKDSSLNQKKIKAFNIFDADNKLKFQVPVDTSARVLINYYGTQMTLPYIPAKELFTTNETMTVLNRKINPETKTSNIVAETVNKKDFLKGRSLIVGATAIGVYDLRTIPLEANYPGPEIHLTMLANLFDENFLTYLYLEAKIFPYIILSLGIIFSFIWAFLGAISSFVSLNILIACLLIIDFFLFKNKNIVFSGFLILIIYLVLSNISVTFYKYFTEEKKKKQLKSTFSKYVSPAVVDELLKSDENLKLGGRRQRMSVFFSDVRGFTTISEKLAPEELSRVLNLYLTPMTEIVFKNKGTLDKYIGDAVMAFFGAPITDKNHAAQACQCALESLDKLKELQIEFANQNLPHIDIGIGINTGEM
ncbi:MAG: adenylate/guanylate cyclase domain-containing protein, partial [Bdellovibrionaceae bacterium]|nr:adenylate/guanylate cyclase domain-containing protein [Pseudobdellovibrionaceae bacterium]